MFAAEKSTADSVAEFAVKSAAESTVESAAESTAESTAESAAKFLENSAADYVTDIRGFRHCPCRAAADSAEIAGVLRSPAVFTGVCGGARGGVKSPLESVAEISTAEF